MWGSELFTANISLGNHPNELRFCSIRGFAFLTPDLLELRIIGFPLVPGSQKWSQMPFATDQHYPVFGESENASP